MNQFEFLVQVFGHCRYQHSGQIFLSCKSFCRNDKLIPQLRKLVEICFAHCKILDQSELFVVIFLGKIRFYIHKHPILSWNLPKSTPSVEFSLSKEAVVLYAMGERDRMLVAETSDLCFWMRVGMISELQFVFYLPIFWQISRDISIWGNFFFFGQCHTTFPYKEILCFFGLCNVKIPFMETFFGGFVQKVIVRFFSDSFVQKTTQQSDGSVLLQVIPSF